ncbi:MAG: hypothetical protein QX199_09665 [Methylococcaceae bacterium]
MTSLVISHPNHLANIEKYSAFLLFYDSILFPDFSGFFKDTFLTNYGIGLSDFYNDENIGVNKELIKNDWEAVLDNMRVLSSESCFERVVVTTELSLPDGRGDTVVEAMSKDRGYLDIALAPIRKGTGLGNDDPLPFEELFIELFSQRIPYLDVQDMVVSDIANRRMASVLNPNSQGVLRKFKRKDDIGTRIDEIRMQFIDNYCSRLPCINNLSIEDILEIRKLGEDVLIPARLELGEIAYNLAEKFKDATDSEISEWVQNHVKHKVNPNIRRCMEFLSKVAKTKKASATNSIPSLPVYFNGMSDRTDECAHPKFVLELDHTLLNSIGSYKNGTHLNLTIGRLDMTIHNWKANQVGAMGPNAQATNVTFQQTVIENIEDVDIKVLTRELDVLIGEMKSRADSPEKHAATKEIAVAHREAEAGRLAGALEHLKNGGSWALSVARDIGVDVISNILTKGLGG